MTMETISELESAATTVCDSVFVAAESSSSLSNQHWTRRAFRGRRSVRIKSDPDAGRRVSRASSVRVARSAPHSGMTRHDRAAGFLDDLDINKYKNGKCIMLHTHVVLCDVKLAQNDVAMCVRARLSNGNQEMAA